jgi:hypothetical protein
MLCVLLNLMYMLLEPLVFEEFETKQKAVRQEVSQGKGGRKR